jgi:hypothetical protein
MNPDETLADSNELALDTPLSQSCPAELRAWQTCHAQYQDTNQKISNCRLDFRLLMKCEERQGKK